MIQHSHWVVPLVGLVYRLKCLLINLSTVILALILHGLWWHNIIRFAAVLLRGLYTIFHYCNSVYFWTDVLWVRISLLKELSIFGKVVPLDSILQIVLESRLHWRILLWVSKLVYLILLTAVGVDNLGFLKAWLQEWSVHRPVLHPHHIVSLNQIDLRHWLI